MVGGSRAPSHSSCGGESFLANVFWRRTGEDRGGFWLSRRPAQSSGAAGLAGCGIRAERVGCQGDAEVDRDVGGIPAVVTLDSRTAREGSAESPAGARTAPAAARGNDSRQCAGGERTLERTDRRSFCVSVPAQWIVGRDVVWRRLLGAKLFTRYRQG